MHWILEVGLHIFVLRTVLSQNGLDDFDLSKHDNSGMRRKVKIALFFSKSLTDEWITKKNLPSNSLTTFMETTFLEELNELWAEPQLGSGIDIQYDITKIHYLSAQEETDLEIQRVLMKESYGDYSGAKAFCSWAAERNQAGNLWNSPVYVIDKLTQADFNSNTPGRAYGVGDICEENCAVIEGKVTNWRLEPLFVNLLAHELGHLFGFKHPPTNCLEDIMWAPGRYSTWSECTKGKAQQILRNPWAYPCLEYQYGVMPPPTVPPGKISDDDMVVLASNCPSGKVETHEGFRGKWFYSNGYTEWIKRIPDWWHEDNVCKWIPCKEKYQNTVLFSAITPMEGRRCGVNKICFQDRCVSAGNSGCGDTKQLTSNSGTFSSYSLNANRQYLPNMNCSWLITAPWGRRVKISFISMNVQGSYPCGSLRWGDAVTVYNGPDARSPRLAALCNGRTETLESSGNTMFVTFTSDGNPSTTGTGFQAVYEMF